MSRDLNFLVPEFRTKVGALLQECDTAEYSMRPFFTLRTPFEQGILWRQSRPTEIVKRKITELKNNGADFLAYCIESAGSQNGRYVTGAIPSLSWHQWGEAIDCYWLLNGESEWSTRKKVEGINGYVNYGETAKNMGLHSGGYWSSLKDWPHVQFRKESSPSRIYSLQEINNEMKANFENN